MVRTTLSNVDIIHFLHYSHNQQLLVAYVMAINEEIHKKEKRKNRKYFLS